MTRFFSRPVPRRGRRRRPRALRRGAARARRRGARPDVSAYLVTGAAASSARTSRTPPRGRPRRRVPRRVHRLLRPGPEAGERRAARRRSTPTCSSTDLDGLLDGVDGVYHLAGQPGVRASFGPDFVHYATRNVQASARLFEAAARHGVRVVYASSSSIYGDAEATRPARTRAAPDLALRRDEALRRAPRLRARALYGPRRGRPPLLHGLRPSPAARHGVPPLLEALDAGDAFPLYGDGTASRSFTFVADAVAATIAAMERGAAGSSTTSAAGRRRR